MKKVFTVIINGDGNVLELREPASRPSRPNGDLVTIKAIATYIPALPAMAERIRQAALPDPWEN
ncbi:MAG: hypothetical protein HQ488_00505 [Parcubacteria group bacterium]|nr:hypothetical protein [Parcubacteria group bacterium]